jgi:hypothetical protein
MFVATRRRAPPVAADVHDATIVSASAKVRRISGGDRIDVSEIVTRSRGPGRTCSGATTYGIP